MYRLALTPEAESTAFNLIPETDKLPSNPKPSHIIEMFNLDQWEAEKISNFNEVTDSIHDSYHIRRSDDKRVLTKYVPDSYSIYQYKDGVNWLNPFIDEGMLSIDSALMLNEGGKFSVLCSIGMEATVNPGDTVERYLLLALSHDKSRRGFYYCDIRPVCANTLYMAQMQGLNKMGKSFELGADPDRQMKQAAKLIDLANRKFHDEEIMRYKAYNKLELQPEQVEHILRSVLNVPQGDKEFASISDTKMMQYRELKEAYKTSPGMELISGNTAWRVLNAVTYFAQTQGKTAADKFSSSLLGGNTLRKNTESLLVDHLPKSYAEV